MLWFYPKEKLQYYNPPATGCYQEYIVYPADILLQGIFSGGSSTFSLKIEVYSTDGKTLYEDATSYFEYYIASNPYQTGLFFFAARLKSFSPAMCSHKCFVLLATITDAQNGIHFISFTEQYRVADCCDVARGVIIDTEGFTVGLEPFVEFPGGGNDGTGQTIPGEPPDTPRNFPIPPPQPQQPTGACGEKLIRIISAWDCEDKFTGEVYSGGNVIQGAYFSFVKITNCHGRIVPRPYEISKQISYNNALQRVESSKQYLLECYDYFPTWKMEELMFQMHAQHLWVDNYNTYRAYRYTGGTPLSKVKGARDCDEIFKLEATLSDAVIRQTLGCGNSCATVTTASYFMIPSTYSGGSFFDGNGTPIADSVEQLVTWFGSQNGVTTAVEMDTSGLDCVVYGAIKVEGLSLIPTSIYYDMAINKTKIYAIKTDDFINICGEIGGQICLSPAIGSIIETDAVCETPVAGSITEEDITPEEVTLTSYNNWSISTPPDTQASKYAGVVTFSLLTTNTSFTEVTGDDKYFANETVSIISPNGRPAAQRVLTNANNTSIPAGITLVINPDGTVQVNGTVTFIADNEFTFDFNNITFNI